jgi:hypothetical protein
MVSHSTQVSSPSKPAAANSAFASPTRNPFAAAPTLPPPALVANSAAPAPKAAPASVSPAAGSQFHNVAEVFRFDVTKEWVYANWPRKTTGLSDPELYGVRVPLVMGTGFSDLAGSLTYSFNSQGQVQHISFLGRTADTAPLVQFLVSAYQFERRDAPAGEQLYQVGGDGQVSSELHTRAAPVLVSTSPQGSFMVELELERPGSARYLTPRVPPLNLPSAHAANAVPASAAPAPGTANGDPNAGAESSYYEKLKHATYDQMRHATPAEDKLVQWKRWPN